MRAEDVLEFTRRKPFKPYRIHATDGRVYHILHSDRVIVLRDPLIIGIGETSVPEHVDQVDLIQIDRVEELESEAPSFAG